MLFRSAAGLTDLNLSLHQYSLRGGRPGLLFLVSDMLSPAGYRDGLNSLLARGYEISLIHLLSPDEADPPLAGDLKLIDIETGADAEITLDPTTLTAYRERLKNWQQEMATFCTGRGAHYIPITTDVPWEKLIMQTLRTQHIIK